MALQDQKSRGQIPLPLQKEEAPPRHCSGTSMEKSEQNHRGKRSPGLPQAWCINVWCAQEPLNRNEWSEKCPLHQTKDVKSGFSLYAETKDSPADHYITLRLLDQFNTFNIRLPHYYICKTKTPKDGQHALNRARYDNPTAAKCRWACCLKTFWSLSFHTSHLPRQKVKSCLHSCLGVFSPCHRFR